MRKICVAWTVLMAVVITCHGLSQAAFAQAAVPPNSPTLVSTLTRSDVNGDCVVDLLDLALVAASYGAPRPFPHALADVNGDNQINVLDLVLVTSNYDWHCPQHNILVSPSCSQFETTAEGGDLNQEYVCLQNADGYPADLTGWHVQDEGGHWYTFPPFSMQGGAYVRLHTGVGTNDATDLYWGRFSTAWNGERVGGDTVYVYDDEWILVDRYTY